MAYLQQDGSPGAGSPQQPQGSYEEGMEAVVHGQYPEHYDPEAPHVYHNNNQQPYMPETKSDIPPTPTATTGPTTTLGMTKKVFWILVGALILLVVLVIGLGVGLGVKMAQADSRSSAQTTATSTVAPSSSTPLPTATYTAPTSTSTPTIPCPSQNLTLYTAASSVQAKFRLYCGFDFSGDGTEAASIASVDTVSMEACMDICASTDTCQGAGWGSTGEVSSTAYTCYLKTNLTVSHTATDAWCFAVNLNTTSSSFSV